MVRVVIADDQGMVRAGIRSLLESEEGIEVVGEAPDGERAVALILDLLPDVVLMDIRMPGLDGITATRRILQAGCRTRIIALTTFDLEEYVFGALRAGASGFLLKDATAEELVAAIRTVAEGDALLAPAVTQRVIDAFVKVQQRDNEVPYDVPALSARERDVLRMVARGLSNSEIADALVLSSATVKTHVSSVLTKLGVRDRVHAAIAAYESGVVIPGERSA